jgi:hypothetical protein
MAPIQLHTGIMVIPLWPSVPKPLYTGCIVVTSCSNITKAVVHRHHCNNLVSKGLGTWIMVVRTVSNGTKAIVERNDTGHLMAHQSQAAIHRYHCGHLMAKCCQTCCAQKSWCSPQRPLSLSLSLFNSLSLSICISVTVYPLSVSFSRSLYLSLCIYQYQIYLSLPFSPGDNRAVTIPIVQTFAPSLLLQTHVCYCLASLV